MVRIYLFMIKIGIDESRIRFRQHMDNELAHYASDCWDCDLESSYGWVECVGCADRSAYDLQAHSGATNQKLIARDTLPEPIVSEKLTLTINKKLFGPAFKKDAKTVESHLESLKESDLTLLQNQLSKG
jgi:glycyl-tRNA synthetase